MERGQERLDDLLPATTKYQSHLCPETFTRINVITGGMGNTAQIALSVAGHNPLK